jgi:hypothetical protein
MIEMPILHQIATLWSLRDYPQTGAPWGIDTQLDAIKSAGFDGVTGRLLPITWDFSLVPEMGPTSSGYNLNSLPNSWEEAVTLRPILEKLWYKTLHSKAHRCS